MKNYLFLLLIAGHFVSCKNGSEFKDDNGDLLAQYLESESGGINFTPMQNSDSADVEKKQPAIYNFEGKPFTGKIVSYNKEKLSMEGYLENGLFSGDWKFYYPSGVTQIEGTYTKGRETGFWKSYYSKDKFNIVKYYDKNGYMLMRKEYYDTGKIKNYQNVNSPEFGNRERRIQFKYNGEVDYIDAEREVGKLSPAEINKLLQEDGLLIK